MQLRSVMLSRSLLFALSIFLWTSAGLEFWNITWGTGTWLGQFSFKWGFAFLMYVLFSLVSLTFLWLLLFDPQKLGGLFSFLLELRQRLGFVRWILGTLILMFPVWLLQYTAWGVILDGPYLRLLIWSLSAALLGYLLTSENQKILGWHGLVGSLLLSEAACVLAGTLRNVTSYPFSLGWSEGNRLWDYSVLFGRRLYDYPADKPIWVLLDIGRQFVGGVPFLLPGLTLWQARLWTALIVIVPYLFLGWIAFMCVCVCVCLCV